MSAACVTSCGASPPALSGRTEGIMILRVLELQWTPFADALCARRDVESAGVVLAERLRGGQVFLARPTSSRSRTTAT